MKETLKKIGAISAKTWLYLFIISAIICVFALRHNNQTMVELRNEVYAADKNNDDVNAALNKLRSYIFAHMNTNLSAGNSIKPPIQLKYTYQRLYDEEYNRIQAANQKIYDRAKTACKPNTSGYDPVRLACIQNYAVNHGVKGADINIPAGLYQFDFVSPIWTPDLAGWTLLLSILFFIALVIRLVTSRLVRR